MTMYKSDDEYGTVATGGATGREHHGEYDPCLTRTWNRHGVQALVADAAGEFERETNVGLPYNLAVHGPWVGCPHHPRIVAGAREMVEEAARFAGWLRAAAEMPLLVRLIARTTSPKGMNSPHTTLGLYALVRVNRSPHRAADRLRKVRQRADKILKPFGMSASYRSLGEVLSSSRFAGCVGKAAVAAAARTVEDYLVGRGGALKPYEVRMSAAGILARARGLRTFMEASTALQYWAADAVRSGRFESLRQALENAGSLVEDSTDGVHLLLDPATVAIYHKVKVMVGWDGEGERQALCRQKGTGRTYHVRIGWQLQPREVVREAIAAWRRQARLERENASLIGVFETNEVTHLIVLDDAQAAGNCSPGITAWMQDHGLSGRRFIRASLLFPYLEDGRVLNTLKAAQQRIQG